MQSELGGFGGGGEASLKEAPSHLVLLEDLLELLKVELSISGGVLGERAHLEPKERSPRCSREGGRGRKTERERVFEAFAGLWLMEPCGLFYGVMQPFGKKLRDHGPDLEAAILCASS